jgi:hypothetical protein
MPLDQAPTTPIDSHGTTQKTQALLANIPCFSVCFRGQLQVFTSDMP